MESKKEVPNVRSSKSSESLYSSPSTKSALTRRRPLGRYSSIVTGVGNNEVRQRVVSARVLRMKNLQNQLNDALQHIANLTTENRLLKTIHKRQDSALSKYESSNAELPQLLQSHAEELRIWQAKYRALHAQNRELAHKLKQKDILITQLTDENKHLTQLNKNKNLEERETLSGRVHYLELRLAEKDEEVKLLERRNRLEAKNFKTQLANENHKYREMCQKFENLNGSTPGSGSGSGSNAKLQHNLKETNGVGQKYGNSFLPRPISIHSINGRSAQLNNLRSGHKIENKELLVKDEDATCLCTQEAEITACQNGNDIALNGNVNIEKDENNIEDTVTEEAIIDHSEMPILNDIQLLNGSDEKDNFNEVVNDLAAVSLENTESSTDNNYMDIKQKSFQEQFVQIKNRAFSNDKSLLKLRSEIEEDIKKNESILDLYCDSVRKDVDTLTSLPNGTSSLPNAKNKLSPINGLKSGQNSTTHATRISKRTPIDPQKKSKLLAALKAIDSN